MEKQQQSNSNQQGKSKSQNPLDLQSLPAQIDQKWVHPNCLSNIINFDLLICPICYAIPLKNKVECLQCGRIFCQDDYNAVKTKGNQCPMCKIKPWKVKDQLHILYKSIFQKISFKCELCQDNENQFSFQELAKHVALQHDKKVQNFQQIHDFEIVFSTKDSFKLTLFQNLHVNYEFLIKKKNDITIELSDGSKLRINVAKKLANHSIYGNAKLILQPSKLLQSQKSYYLWQINLDKGFQLYKQELQQKFEQNYELYIKNPRLNEFNFDIGQNRYRISFKYMIQTNTTTQFQRGIKRVEVKFN